jgi:cobalt-zinc-cadmium efflux system outer membrane protein
MTLGIRIPFGSDSRNRAKQATAQAEGIEAEAQLSLERQRLLSELDAARIRLESAGTQMKAADRRSQLARESRGFFQKSFRMGETDLPTRLRVELEASDAERQAARARIELAAAVSALRQALGLLPE